MDNAGNNNNKDLKWDLFLPTANQQTWTREETKQHLEHLALRLADLLFVHVDIDHPLVRQHVSLTYDEEGNPYTTDAATILAAWRDEMRDYGTYRVEIIELMVDLAEDGESAKIWGTARETKGGITLENVSVFRFERMLGVWKMTAHRRMHGVPAGGISSLADRRWTIPDDGS